MKIRPLVTAWIINFSKRRLSERERVVSGEDQTTRDGMDNSKCRLSERERGVSGEDQTTRDAP